MEGLEGVTAIDCNEIDLTTVSGITGAGHAAKRRCDLRSARRDSGREPSVQADGCNSGVGRGPTNACSDVLSAAVAVGSRRGELLGLRLIDGRIRGRYGDRLQRNWLDDGECMSSASNAAKGCRDLGSARCDTSCKSGVHADRQQQRCWTKSN